MEKKESYNIKFFFKVGEGVHTENILTYLTYKEARLFHDTLVDCARRIEEMGKCVIHMEFRCVCDMFDADIDILCDEDFITRTVCMSECVGFIHDIPEFDIVDKEMLKASDKYDVVGENLL